MQLPIPLHYSIRQSIQQHRHHKKHISYGNLASSRSADIEVSSFDFNDTLLKCAIWYMKFSCYTLTDYNPVMFKMSLIYENSVWRCNNFVVSKL